MFTATRSARRPAPKTARTATTTPAPAPTFVIAAVDAVDAPGALPLVCGGCFTRLAGREHLGVALLNETMHWCTAACRTRFIGGAR